MYAKIISTIALILVFGLYGTGFGAEVKNQCECKQTEIKILVSGGVPLTETSALFTAADFFMDKTERYTTASDLLKQGWRLHQMVPIGVRQQYWIFVR